MTPAEARLLYADSSALVKLVIDERESSSLTDYLGAEVVVGTSRIALVEVGRAVTIANPSPEARAEVDKLLASCLLIDVDDRLLRDASDLASSSVRSLDAIHLASARRIDPDEVLVYDRGLRDAAIDAGFAVASPGA